jgi:hypothetical protein
MLELAQHRLGERVADDGDHRRLLALDDTEQLRCIEALGIVEQNHRTAGEPRDHGAEPAGAVHERRADQRPRRQAG